MAQPESISAPDSAMELACLCAHGHLYGVDVTQLREIVRCQEVTPLPKAPELIEGVMDLRGRLLPVVDLGRALGAVEVTPGPQARIAVLQCDDMSFGLRVESAVDVLSVGPDELHEPPALATHAGYEVVRSVIRRSDGPPILVLSIEHLLECIYRSGISDAGES